MALSISCIFRPYTGKVCQPENGNPGGLSLLISDPPRIFAVEMNKAGEQQVIIFQLQGCHNEEEFTEALNMVMIM